jgi:hypothetical protein
MYNHLNLKILIHIFTIIFLIMIIIIMRGENFVAHLEGVGGTPVAHHWIRVTEEIIFITVPLRRLDPAASRKQVALVLSQHLGTIVLECFHAGLHRGSNPVFRWLLVIWVALQIIIRSFALS